MRGRFEAIERDVHDPWIASSLRSSKMTIVARAMTPE
jgi:hypothetical protein